MDLVDIYKKSEEIVGNKVELKGWVKNHRKQKEFGFIDFSDGTCFKSIQIVYDNKLDNFDDITHIRVGSSIEVEGIIVKNPKKEDVLELQASMVSLIGDSLEDYPIQPKRHTREFLREVAYLRPRTNLFQAVFRIRSLCAMAIHEYFQNNGYLYVHTPLITTADCEGSDQMFKVTTFNLDKLPKDEMGHVDMKEDLFGKQAYITGSGQLHGEAFALSFKKIYTFGPTFRSENSNTKTHANEFWMIEPEIAFCDLDELMDVEESMLKYVISYVLKKASDELEFLDSFVEKGLVAKLKNIVESNFVRITHHDAIDILKKADVEFEFTPDYNEDLAKEHEKYITEYFNKPVFITNWPKDIKSYYMKQNDDGKTVRAVDLEVPGVGELMGGSVREDDYQKLLKRVDELHLDKEVIDWYLNLRLYGGCLHAGFGLGFERLIMYLTGIENIRDVIPFPRTPGNCLY